MSRPIRKQISFSVVDMEEIYNIKKEHNDLHNNSDVIKFLLYEYLKDQERKSEQDEVLKKLGKMEKHLERLIIRHSYQQSDCIPDEDETIEEYREKAK